MKRVTILLLFAAVALSSCYKTDLYEPTGGNGGGGNEDNKELVIEIPDLPTTAGESYTLYIEGEAIEVDESGKATLPDTMTEGEYTAYVYNDPVNTTIESSATSCIASVEIVDGKIINGNPGVLNFGTQSVTVTADGVTTTTPKMEQITRELKIELSFSGDAVSNITKVTALLDGVAQQWDCVNNTVVGEAYSVAPTLAKAGGAQAAASRAGSDSTLEGEIYLLGVDPDAEQKLTITLEYDDVYSTTDKVVVSDLSAEFKDFNSDKSTPFTLSQSIDTSVDREDIAIVTPDLPAIADGDSYTMYIDGETLTMDKDGNVTLPKDLEEGKYSAYVGNNPTNITIQSDATSTIATVESAGDNTIKSDLGVLFFGKEEITIAGNRATATDLKMEQITRELNFALTLAGDATSRVTKVTALLDGVAQQWDCQNNTMSGSSASVAPTLTQSAASTLKGKIYLLGVDPDAEQKLTITLEYADSNPATHKTIVSNISEQLDGFNDDKATPLTLSGTVETPTSAGDGTAEIINWSVSKEGDLTFK